MKCQNLFSGKNINLSSAELAQRVVNVNISLITYLPSCVKSGTTCMPRGEPSFFRQMRMAGSLKINEQICLFVCVEVLRPVNPMGSCRMWSVYLTTRLLGRLSPLSG